MTTTKTDLPFERVTKQPVATFVDITPTMAKEMLTYNVNNRPMRQKRIVGIVEQLNKKQWLASGETIKFDTDGTLIDGQHRLAGCVEAKMTLRNQLVVTGLPKQAFSVIDSGLKRQPKDVLDRIQMANTTQIAAASRIIQVLEAGLNPFNSEVMSELITRQDILNHCKQNQDLIDWALRLARPVYETGKIGNVTALTALAVLAVNFGYERSVVEEFVNKLASGEGLNGNSPILALRNHLIREREQKRNRGVEHLGNYIVAFNSWVAGVRVRKHRRYMRDMDFPKFYTPSEANDMAKNRESVTDEIAEEVV
jgi:hypothetical protein